MAYNQYQHCTKVTTIQPIPNKPGTHHIRDRTLDKYKVCNYEGYEQMEQKMGEKKCLNNF